MQALPPARPRRLTSSAVPQQQTPIGADPVPADVARPVERPGVPAPRPEPAPSSRPRPGGVPGVRARPPQPDAVVFTAPCPACGAECDWTEQREDTRLHAVVSCSCG